MIKHQKLKIYLFIVFQITPVYLEAASTCTEWVAKAVSVQGKVETRQAGNSSWENTLQGDVFCQGVTIRADNNSRATLQLSNESMVSVDQNTSLNINISTPKVKASSWLLELLEGSAFFRSRESQRLNIHTPFINAVHEGTEFLVTVDSDKTEITVFDGQVAATNQQGKIQIKKGYKGIAKKDQPPRVKALTIRPEDAVQWTLYYPPLIDYQHIKSSSLQSAVNAYDQGDIYQALNDLENVPVTQQNVDYLILKASLLLSVGRADEALTLVKQAPSTKQNSTAIALQAVIAVSKNRQDEALNLARQAVTLQPQSAVAQIALSYAYQANFKIEPALQSTQEAVRLSPDNALAWARLSELQLSMGERSDALESAKKAQRLNPKLDRTQTILGFAHLTQVDIDEASVAFKEAINLNSADPLARLGLGLAKIRKGNVKEGARDLETAVSLDPDNSIMRSYLGKAYYELKEDGYAGTELAIAKEMDSNDPTPWLYDAILKQITNQPAEALFNIQKSIELNDNRAVYRSRLLLDEDYAVRGTNLSRIYDDLGFEHLATLEATKSINLYPSNHSAHRFLSDSYIRQPRHEIASASELLQSQLLQPINYNFIKAQSGVTDLNIVKGIGSTENSFNEFNRVFEGNGSQFATSGIFGNNDTYGDEAVLSGIYDKFSYSLGQLFYTTDGFRENNDLQHNIYNVFTQYTLSPMFNVQAEYRYRKTGQGDLELKGSPSNFLDSKRRNLDQSTYRLGFRLSPDLKSNFVASAIYAKRKETIKQKQVRPNGGIFEIEQNGNQEGYQLELQHLFHGNNFNSIAGGGTYLYDVEQELKLTGQSNKEDNFRRNHFFGYLYSDVNVLKNVTATLGLSFDSYKDKKGNGLEIEAFNPKIGLRWLINDNFTMRLAAFRTVKSSIVVNQTIQPTQVAGFNQFYDDLNGTKAVQYNFGLDAKFAKNIFSGFEFFYRDIDQPAFNNNLQNFENRNNNEQLYRIYLNWLPHTNWAINSEIRLENYNGDQKLSYDQIETAYLPLTFKYFNTVGIFAELGGTYIHQSIESNSQRIESFTSNFYLLDASVGYRFPKQYGSISFEANNLLNKHFKFRDRNFQMNEVRVSEILPELTFMARITFNF